MRSCSPSNESTNERTASRTVGHWAPIELDTSRTSERSTMRRVASPVAETVTLLKFPSFMNVVGITTDAVMSTVLTPVAAST